MRYVLLAIILTVMILILIPYLQKLYRWGKHQIELGYNQPENKDE